MIDSNPDTMTIRLAGAFSVSRPTFAAPPALAKATVYMPSSVAARLIPATLAGAYKSREDRLRSDAQKAR